MKLSNPGIILQARLNSRRFPNKVLAEINGKKLIDIVVDECDKTGLGVVVAIPHTDDRLGDYLCKQHNVFRGSENDVISRIYHCAKTYNIDPIIRVCCDAKNIHSDLILQELDNYNKYKHI